MLPNILGCVAFHWSLVNLAGHLLLKMTLLLSSVNNSLVTGGPLFSSLLFLLNAGIWFGLRLHGACPCCHNWYEFISAASLCPENTISLYLSAVLALAVFPHPLSQWFLNFERKNYEKDTLFVAGHSIVTYSLHLDQLVVFFCVNWHLLLLLEPSLMWAETCIYLWV